MALPVGLEVAHQEGHGQPKDVDRGDDEYDGKGQELLPVEVAEVGDGEGEGC